MNLVENELKALSKRLAKPKNGIRVSFSYRYDEETGWDDEDNVSPYISLLDPTKSIEGQRFPNEIVIPMSEILIIFDYPLENAITFPYQGDCEGGFTRAHLARCVCTGYKRIYDEEEAAVGDPGTVSSHCMNRATSHGPYGIWGHGLGDLVLHTVTQVGENIFTLGVDS